MSSTASMRASFPFPLTVKAGEGSAEVKSGVAVAAIFQAVLISPICVELP